MISTNNFRFNVLDSRNFEFRKWKIENTLILKNEDDLNKIYLNKAVDDFDLEDIKTVYFDKTSNFSRFKLSEYTNIKRCIKVEKADAIITAIPQFNKYSWCNLWVFKSESQNALYFDYEYQYLNDETCKQWLGVTTVTPYDLLNKLISLGHFPDDCKFVYRGIVHEINAEKFTSINLIRSTDKKVILDSVFNNKITKTLQNPTYEDINTIGELLQSSDIATVELGMKLLQNYNVIDKACSIGFMLLKNGKSILNTKTYKSKDFQTLLATLNLQKHNLSCYYESSFLRYAEYFSKICTNEEDIAKHKEMVIELCENEINELELKLQERFKAFNISIECKIKYD